MRKLKTDEFDVLVAGSALPVLVDFYSDGCAPCRMLSVVLRQLEEEFVGRVEFCAVNVGEDTGVADRFKISSVPTIMVFVEGRMVHREIGYRDKSELVAILDRFQRKVLNAT